MTAFDDRIEISQSVEQIIIRVGLIVKVTFRDRASYLGVVKVILFDQYNNSN